jgi:hypothetical protein
MQDIHEQVLSLEKQLTHIRIENWLNQDVFSWQWWLLVVVLIVPWLFWWWYVDKKRIFEIFALGTASLILSSYLDAIITELGLWSYHVWVIPLWPRLIPADFTVIPVTFMFVYQKYNSWRNYIIAMVVTSAIFSFVGETFLEWIEVYKLEEWRHIYSFPIYIAIGILVKWLIQRMGAKQDIVI